MERSSTNGLGLHLAGDYPDWPPDLILFNGRRSQLNPLHWRWGYCWHSKWGWRRHKNLNYWDFGLGEVIIVPSWRWHRRRKLNPLRPAFVLFCFAFQEIKLCMCISVTSPVVNWLSVFESLPCGRLNPFIMMTSWHGNIFRVTGGPFVRGIHRLPVISRSFDVFFDLRLNKWLSKQSWGWWFETPSPPLWRHSNAYTAFKVMKPTYDQWQ